MAAAVEVQDVTRRFGAITALDGVSLAIREGEIYGLLGPNGSGKTTLIRMLVGLVTPGAGTVRVLGQRAGDIATLSRIGYMTQKPALYPDLSVRENIAFFAAVYGRTASIDETLDLVHLRERAGSVVSTLSGGMQQRLSLACALVHRPSLLLLDEPTVGIDPLLRVEFWQHFRRLAAQGTTIIVSSHVMDEAERADRLGLLRFGRLLAEGTAAELVAHANAASLEDAFVKLSGGAAEALS